MEEQDNDSRIIVGDNIIYRDGDGDVVVEDNYASRMIWLKPEDINFFINSLKKVSAGITKKTNKQKAVVMCRVERVDGHFKYVYISSAFPSIEFTDIYHQAAENVTLEECEKLWGDQYKFIEKPIGE